MSQLQIDKENQNDVTPTINSKAELEKWENEQLEIFSDIIISILLKSKDNNDAEE